MVDMQRPNLFELNSGSEPAVDSGDVIQDALRGVRNHLGMEVGFLTEIVGEKSIFRSVDAPGFEGVIKPGEERPLSQTYCQHILEGRLPGLITNTSDHPLAQHIAITDELPVGAHISVPVCRRDGSVFGMFSCLSSKPRPGLNSRDLNIMKMFARLAEAEVQDVMEARRIADEAEMRVREVMSDGNFRMVFQPILDLETDTVAGFEALCRFDAEPVRSPDQWFEEASDIGLGVELELCVLEATLGVLPILPKPLYLSVNAGPDLVATGKLTELFAGHDATRLVLEVTEHASVGDAAALARALSELRDIGVRIAVDDDGAGVAGLQQIARLQPQLIKLDRALISGIDANPAQRALCAALMHYTSEAGAELVAEGIETEEEAQALKELGVHQGQGWLLGKPLPLDEVLASVKGRVGHTRHASHTGGLG